MYPVVFCRNTSGVSVELASRMNSLAFLASLLNSTPRWLARTPTGYPCTRAQPVASEVPYSGLYSSKSEESTTRARISRGSNGTFTSADTRPRISSGSNLGGAAGPLKGEGEVGGGPCLRQLILAMMSRPMRRARRRRSSPRARRPASASRRRPAIRRRIPRRWPSSPAAARRGTPWPARPPGPRSRTCRARRRRVGGQFGELVEDPAGRDEQVGLRRQVRAARLHQVHHREPVGAGDLQRAQRLA